MAERQVESSRRLSFCQSRINTNSALLAGGKARGSEVLNVNGLWKDLQDRGWLGRGDNELRFWWLQLFKKEEGSHLDTIKCFVKSMMVDKFPVKTHKGNLELTQKRTIGRACDL